MFLKRQERYLGIQLTSDLNWSIQVKTAANKAYNVLWMLKRKFTYSTKETTNVLYTKLEISHLEYAASACNSYRKKNEKIFESLQKRATKLIPELKKKTQLIAIKS